MSFIRADRASIEAEIDAELASHPNVDVEELARRIAHRLRVDVETCLAIARERLPAPEVDEALPAVAPGILSRQLLERAIASGRVKWSDSGQGGRRVLVSTSRPGATTVTSLMRRHAPSRSHEQLESDVLGALEGARRSIEAPASSGDDARTTPAPEDKPSHYELMNAALGADLLERPIVAELERASGADLSQLQIHTDSAAAEKADGVGAHAFAKGRDIYFGAGEFDPTSTTGRRLIAHEVAHTIQQRSVVAPPPATGSGLLTMSADFSGAREESEANAFADAFVRGTSVPSLSPAPASIARKPKRDSPPRGDADEKEGNKARDARLAKTLGDENFVLVGQSAVVSTKWFLAGALNPNGDQIRAPSRFAELLREWKENRTYWWIEEDEIDALSKKVGLLGTFDRTGKAFQMDVAVSVYELLGPPPNSPIQWRVGSSSLILIIANKVIGESTSKADSDGDYTTSRALTTAALAALEVRTGVPLGADERRDLLHMGFTTKVKPDTKAWVKQFSAYEVSSYFYDKETWEQIVKGSAAASKKEHDAAGPGNRFEDTVSDEDKSYFMAWIKELELPAGQTGPGYLIGGAEISALRKIDEQGFRDQVRAKLKEGGDGGSTPLDYRTLTNLLAAAKRAKAAKTVGMDDPPGALTDEQPIANHPVVGRIINQAGYIYVGLDCEFDYEVDSQASGWSSPHITIRWVAHPEGEPTKHTDREVCSYIDSARHSKDSFNITFPQEGIYVVHAFVNHEWFQPNHEQTKVEVTTKEKRLRQVEGGAFEGFGTTPARLSHDFETSNFNEAYGDKDSHVGKELKGRLPADFKRRSFEERKQFITAKREQMNALLASYKGTSSRHEAVQEYANDFLETLQAAEDRLNGLKTSGYTFFDVRGSFLSDGNGVPDRPLQLMGAAKKRGDRDVSVKLHDYSRLSGDKDKHFSGSGSRMQKAIEDAFLDLSKSYPPGTVTILCELLDATDMSSTGKTYGFRLDSGTAWKSIKSTVWDPAVQIGVNIVGAGIMLVFPPSAAVLFPALAAYNITRVVDDMATLHAEGNLTGKKVFISAMEIGLNVLPYLGSVKAVGKLGGVMRYTIPGLEIGGEALLLTVEGLTTLRDFREKDIMEIAQLHAKYQQLERDNPSNPELAKLKALIDKKVDTAQERVKKIVADSLVSGAVSVAPGLVMSRIQAKQRLDSPKAMKEDGVIIAKEGAAPHYDAETGHIVGDNSKLDKDTLSALRQEYEADWASKRGRLGALLGTDGDGLMIRHTQGGDVTVAKFKDGIGYEISIPAGTKFNDAMAQVKSKADALTGKPGKGKKAKGKKAGDRTTAIEDDLGVKVTPDDSLGNGAKVDYRLNDKGEVVIERLRVGPHASADVIAVHKRVMARMRRYNGSLGSLRSMWDTLSDRLTKLMGKRPKKNPFLSGTRGYESFEELHKLDELIARRTKRWKKNPDEAFIQDEIDFYEGRREYHQDLVDATNLGELQYQKGRGFVEAPKVGEITARAKSENYPMPAENAEWYYYRQVPESRKVKGGPQYELAKKSGAPKDLELKTLQPEVIDGLPSGRLIEPKRKNTKVTISATETADESIARFLGPDSKSSLRPYAEMMQREGLATIEDVGDTVRRLREGEFAGAVDQDAFRHAIKEVYREKVLKRLLDPELDAAASHRRMRDMTAGKDGKPGLNNKDKANLTEAWYNARHAPNATPEVAIPGQDKPRFADMVEGGEAIEVKSGSGKLSENDLLQLEQYQKAVTKETEVTVEGKEVKLEAMRYVFTDPAGAKANLDSIEKLVSRQDRIATVEVFDKNGVKTLITKASEIPQWMR